MTVTAPAVRRSLDFGRAYVRTMRPYLLWVSGVTGLAGLSLTPGVPTPDAVLLGLVFLLSYGFGQALTDCFHLDTDALSAPDRPLVAGTVLRRHVFLVSMVALVTSGAIVVSYHFANLLLAPLAVLGLATYTWFKRRWWGGPGWNAAIVVVLLFIGWTSGAGATDARLAWNTSVTGAVIASFMGYASFVLVGYLKDVAADRATGYRTLPVVFGWRATRPASHTMMAIAVLGTMLSVVGSEIGSVPTPASLFLVAGVMAAAVGQWRLSHVHEETRAHRAIVPTVHAYVLLLSAITAAHQPGWAPALAVGYLAFAGAMERRPTVAQV